MKSADFINECAMRGMATGQTAAFGTVNGVPFTVNVVTAKQLSITFVLDRQISADEKTAMCNSLKFAGVNGGANGYTVTVTVPLDPAENSVPTITPWFRNAAAVDAVFAAANAAVEAGRRVGISFGTVCPYCSRTDTDAVMYCEQRGAIPAGYRAVHTECANSLRNAANEAKVNDEGNYFTGIIGAIIGMILGVVLNVAVIFGTERIYAMLCALIPLGAFFGYKLLKGRMNSFAIVISIICSALGAVALTLGVDIADSMINYDYTFEEAILLIQYGMAEMPEYADAIRSSLLQDLLFVGLGVLCCIGVLRKNTNSGKAAYAGNLYATLRMKDGSLPAPAADTVDDTASHGA